MVSGTTLAITFLGLAFFPMSFLQSLGYAGPSVLTLQFTVLTRVLVALLTALAPRLRWRSASASTSPWYASHSIRFSLAPRCCDRLTLAFNFSNRMVQVPAILLTFPNFFRDYDLPQWCTKYIDNESDVMVQLRSFLPLP